MLFSDLNSTRIPICADGGNQEVVPHDIMDESLVSSSGGVYDVIARQVATVMEAPCYADISL